MEAHQIRWWLTGSRHRRVVNCLNIFPSVIDRLALFHSIVVVLLISNNLLLLHFGHPQSLVSVFGPHACP